MNLPETQVRFRQALLFIGVATFIFYTGRFLINGTISIIQAFLPKEVVLPEAEFGVLPQLKMKSITIEGQPEYVLDTNTGGLPGFPDRVKVYQIPEPQSTLLAEQSVKELASDLGFTTGLTKKSASEFKWVDGVTGRTFDADVVSKAFSLNTVVDKLSSVVNNSTTIVDTDAIAEAEQFVQSKNLLGPVDVSNINFETYPSNVNVGRLRESSLNANNAKLVKVDIFRDIIVPSLDPNNPDLSFKVLGPSPKDSLMSFYVTNSQDENFRFPLISFDYWQIDYSSGSDYYLASIESVWEAVINGNGVNVHLKKEKSDYYERPKPNTNVEKIEIRDVSLAYYETKEYQGYLQPIYVFEGKFIEKPEPGQLAEVGEIVIYYPAVRGDFVASN